MATWADNYNKQVRAALVRHMINSRASGSEIKPGPQDIAYQMMQRSAKNQPITSHTTGKAGKNALGRTLDVGKYLLQVLGTGNFTVANTLSETMKEGKINIAQRAIKEGRAPNILDALLPNRSIGDIADVTGAGVRGIGGGLRAGFSPEDDVESRKTFSDVFKENHFLDEQPFFRGLAGFAADVAFDPLTYVGGAGIPASLGRSGLRSAAKKATLKSADNASEALEKTASPVARGTAEDAENKVNSLLEALNVPKLKEFDIAETPFTPKSDIGFTDGRPAPISLADDAFDASKIDDFSLTGDAPARVPRKFSPAEAMTIRARHEAIQDQLQNIPTYRYADNLDISPTVIETTEKVVPKGAKAPKVTRASDESATPVGTGIDEAKSMRIAARQAVLSDPNYRIKLPSGSVVPLSKAIEMAQKSPNPEAAMKKLNEEINRLATAILKGDAEKPLIHLESGGKHTTGISLDVFAKFLREGMAPAPKKYASSSFDDLLSGTPLSQAALEQDEWLKQFPVAHIEDLKNFFVRTSTGERKSLQEIFDLVASRNVASAMGKDVKKIKKLTPEAMEKWRAKYADVLDPEDMDSLLAAKNATDFKKRLSAIMAKPGSAALQGGVEGLEQAIKNGLVRADDLKPLMKILGVKKPSELVAKIKRAEKELADLDEAIIKGTPTLDDFVSEGLEGWSKTQGYNPDPTWDQIDAAVKNVTPADELIAKVQQGDASDFLTNKNVLDTQQADIFDVAFQEAWVKNIIDPAKYPFVTNILKTKRTHRQMWKGKGRNYRGWNQYSQADVFRSIIRQSNKILDERFPKVKGPRRSKLLYDYTMPILRAMEDTLKAGGVPMILGKGNEGHAVGLFDVLNSLPRKLVERHLFDYNKSLLPTQFNEAAEIMMQFGLGNIERKLAEDMLRALFWSPVKPNPKTTLDSNFRKWIKGLAPESGPPAANIRMGRNMVTPQQYVNTLVRDFLESTPKMMQQLERNAAQFKMTTDSMAKPITDEIIEQVTKTFGDPARSHGDRIQILDNIDRLAEAVGTANKASSHARDAAKDSLKASLGDTVDAAAASEAGAARAASAAAKKKGNPNGEVPPDDAAKINRERVEVNQKLVDDEFPEMDLPGKIELGFFATVARSFNPHFNVGDLRKLHNEANTAGEVVARGFGALAAKVSKTHAADDIKRAWVAAQTGASPDDPAVAGALSDLNKMLGSLFDTNRDYNSIRRFGLQADQINRWMKHFGVPDMYRFDPEDLANSWRNWEDVRDPLDLITRTNAAIHFTQTLSTTGAQFTHFGMRAGVISNTPKPGFTKLSGKGIEQISPFIDKNLFYDKEAIEQLRFFNQFLRETQKPLAENMLLRTLDTALHGIKAGYTIYRPGHHLRNLVGNISLNFLAGQVNPRYWTDAARMLYNTRGRYSDWDKLQAIRNMPVAGRMGAENATTKVVIGGRADKLSDEQVVKLAMQNGVLPDYHVLEDISFANTAVDRAGFIEKLPKGLRAPFGGKVQRFAGQASQLNDHLARLSQFSWELGRGVHKGKTLEEVAQSAARRTRKWHPDGTDLTNFERRVMRRSQIFYSWQRKIIPLVLEAMVTRPGRVMIYPKAYYNFAESMGLDLNSLADPFPQDQLFPSWMTDQATGPLYRNDEGHYIGVNPGVVQTDVLNQYGSPDKFVRAILGGSIPFVKIPFELATGTDVATGAKIMDTSEYIDRQIPVVGSIGSIANVSPTGSIANMGADPRREVVKGYENPGADNKALVNWLTGLGIIDMSKPNYIKSAEFDLREQARKEGLERDRKFREQFNQ